MIRTGLNIVEIWFLKTQLKEKEKIVWNSYSFNSIKELQNISGT